MKSLQSDYTEKLENVRNFLENFDERVNCCKDKPAETRLDCLKTVLKSTLESKEAYIELCKGHENLNQDFQSMIVALESERDELKEAVGAKDLGLGYLNNEYQKITKSLYEKKDIIGDLKREVRRQEIRLELQDKQIKDLMKSLDENKATVASQSKIIKQQKQRIGKADKQSTKNHNLKMQTETLKSKVSKLQEEVDTMKECKLCFEPYDHGSHKPSVAKCNHIFCKDCLTKHTHSNTGCPMCRQNYTIRDVRELHLHFV